MNTKYIYITFVVAFAAATAFLLFGNTQAPNFTFVERIEGNNASAEWRNSKVAIQSMLTDLKKNPDNTKVKVKLAHAYIHESRVTGNHAYYDAAALTLLQNIPTTDANYFDVLCATATIQLSQHHFQQALQTGSTLVAQNPYSAFAYGILTDAHLELGNYTEAETSANKMVALRPDIRSYARVAYLREIFGDTHGAIQSMTMAVNSAIAGLEQTEWCRYQLGKLYEATGNVEQALLQYKTSLAVRPHYPYALSGIADIEFFHQRYPVAIDLYTQAARMSDDYMFCEKLFDTYTVFKQPYNAAAMHRKCITLLGNNSGNETDNLHGHYTDKELAAFYLKTNNYKAALHHANLELQRRPQNIEVNALTAAAYYRLGQIPQAMSAIQKVLHTGTVNGNFLLMAALIYQQSGNTLMATNILHRVDSTSLTIDRKLWHEASSQIAAPIMANR